MQKRHFCIWGVVLVQKYGVMIHINSFVHGWSQSIKSHIFLCLLYKPISAFSQQIPDVNGWWSYCWNIKIKWKYLSLNRPLGQFSLISFCLSWNVVMWNQNIHQVFFPLKSVNYCNKTVKKALLTNNIFLVFFHD